MSTQSLPRGLECLTFGEIAESITERVDDPSSSGLDYYVGLEHLDPDSLRISRWGSPSDVTATKLRFYPGDVIYARRRAYQRKLGVADRDGVCSAHALVLRARPAVCLPQFLPYFLQSNQFHQRALEISVGSLSPTINWRVLANCEFQLPTLTMQARAVELLTAVETESAAIAVVKRRATDLRSAIIEDSASKPNLPIVSVRDVVSTQSQGVQVGPFGGSLSSKYFSERGVPVLKINNIMDSGELDLSGVVRTPKAHAKTLSRYIVETGDVVTASQATIGRTAVVTEEAAGSLISQHLIRIRVDIERYRPAFLAEIFNSPLVLRQMAAVKTKTTRDGLNTADVESFRIPALPLIDQDIVLRSLSHVQKAAIAANAHERSVSLLARSLVSDVLKDLHV